MDAVILGSHVSHLLIAIGCFEDLTATLDRWLGEEFTLTQFLIHLHFAVLSLVSFE